LESNSNATFAKPTKGANSLYFLIHLLNFANRARGILPGQVYFLAWVFERVLTACLTTATIIVAEMNA